MEIVMGRWLVGWLDRCIERDRNLYVVCISHIHIFSLYIYNASLVNSPCHYNSISCRVWQIFISNLFKLFLLLLLLSSLILCANVKNSYFLYFLISECEFTV